MPDNWYKIGLARRNENNVDLTIHTNTLKPVLRCKPISNRIRITQYILSSAFIFLTITTES